MLTHFLCIPHSEHRADTSSTRNTQDQQYDTDTVDMYVLNAKEKKPHSFDAALKMTQILK